MVALVDIRDVCESRAEISSVGGGRIYIWGWLVSAVGIAIVDGESIVWMGHQ